MRTRPNAALVVLMLLSAVLAYGGERTFEKKFSVSAGGTLRLATDVGTVRITGSGSNEVTVNAILRGRDKDINDFYISADQSSNGVEIKGKSPHHFWFWNTTDLEVVYTIGVPQEYNLQVHTSGGDVEVNSVKGSVKGGTSGGNLVLNKTDGQVELETSGGDIKVDNAAGTLRMHTSGGGIVLTSVTGDVNVETSGGDIRAEGIDGKVRAETSGGNVSVKVKGTNRGVEAETSGGNITIAVGKDVGATIDAATSGGDVTCDLPITMNGKVNETRIRGTVNGGGPTIHAHTSGGNVHIVAAE